MFNVSVDDDDDINANKKTQHENKWSVDILWFGGKGSLELIWKVQGEICVYL